MKRICVVVQSYYLRDPRVRREAEALVEAGYEVDVLTLKDRKEPWRETVNGVRIYRLPLARKRGSRLRYVFEYGTFVLMAAVAQAILHLRRRYALIHVNNMPDILVFSALVPKLLGAKVLFDVHDPMPEQFVSKYGLGEHSLSIKAIRALERLSHRFAHFTITVSDVMRDRLVRLGVPAAKVGVVLNVPDTRIFRRVRGEDAEQAGNGAFTLLFTGTVAQRYGLDIAMRAVARLQSRCPGLRLKIVGEGDHMPCLLRLRKELDARFVDFAPPVPITRIPEIAAGCDAAIEPHVSDCYMELCLSTKVIESIAMGLPVIASATQTLKRYFDDSEVVFVKPGDEADLARNIERLYNDRDLRRSLVEQGAKVLERLNWDNEKKKFLHIVESVIAGRRPEEEKLD